MQAIIDSKLSRAVTQDGQESADHLPASQAKDYIVNEAK
eukprot:CAMPEP_0168454284 /NCGR_PEP_ID=MMETSP0228-20121227/50138_1 /TAXON_ID=133427 /ORGANISM="Protoceratium reticulatum, Strain CCCM 535 (=CCMP 1889)" /LENGTH=38 /DNA_ID= /DNA_START= /DNA_END= /DNA_ORIENTATION=